MSPQRIQRKRTKGWKLPPNARCVNRGSRWGNPFYLPGPKSSSVVGQPWGLLTEPLTMPTFTSAYVCGDVTYVTCSNREGAVVQAVDLFGQYCANRKREIPDSFAAWLQPLRGKDLACYCTIDAPCHADVLLELANG